MLSIVMVTIPERWVEFRKLRFKLFKQIDYCREVHSTLGEVEIVVIDTPKFSDGGLTIGAKRQKGLEISKGEYVCWLDDDDDISPNYVETLLRLSNKGADVCTFNNITKLPNFWCVVQMKLSTKHDDQVKPGIINRRPYHICAWRRSMIHDISFPDANWDEDTGFIAQALKRAKTEVNTEAILHEYNRNEISYAEEVCR